MCSEDCGVAGSHGKLAQAIASQLRPAVLAEFDKAMAAVFVAGAEVGSLIFKLCYASCCTHSVHSRPNSRITLLSFISK